MVYLRSSGKNLPISEQTVFKTMRAKKALKYICDKLGIEDIENIS